MRRLFDVVRLRARSLFRRSRADEELDRELRAHLENQARPATRVSPVIAMRLD